MVFWLRRGRETAERIGAVAEAFIHDHGVEAYGEALRMERESGTPQESRNWSRVAGAIAERIGRPVGVDTAAGIAPIRQTVVCAANSPPATLRSADQPPRPSRFPVQSRNVAREPAAPILVEVAAEALRETGPVSPPRVKALRVIETEGRERPGRRKSDRR